MSAETLRRAAGEIREAVLSKPEREHGWQDRYDLAVADWLEAEANGDGRRPHRYPMPPPDGEVVAWVCQACGETINGFSRQPNDCATDWRARDPLAVAVAVAALGE